MSAVRLSHLSGAALLFLLAACGDQNPAAPTFTPAAEPKLILLDGLASIDGRFSNAVPEPGGNPSPVYCGGGALPTCVSLGFPATPSSQVRWGTPAGGSRSGLGFQGSTGLTINTNTEFPIGTLTHFNFPGTGSIDAVTLTFTLTLPGLARNPHPVDP